MKFSTAITTLCLALVSVVAFPTETDTRVNPPPGFKITSVAVNGNGCPAGTTSVVLSNNGDPLTLSFSNFYAQAGPGVPITRNQVTCKVSLKVSVPQGYKFVITSIDNKGYYQLSSPKVKAIQKARYDIGSSTSTFIGPNAGIYASTAVFTPTPGTSPCGSNTIVNIQSTLIVDNSADKTTTGYISLDTQQGYAFNWYIC